MTKLKCQLKRPPFYQCCCVCASHLNIVDVDFNPSKKWVCTLPIDMGKKSWGKEPLVVIECGEHSGGCECWIDTRKRHVCHADSDGDCTWKDCPQIRDGEPEKTGRDCPLWTDDEEY